MKALLSTLLLWIENLFFPKKYIVGITSWRRFNFFTGNHRKKRYKGRIKYVQTEPFEKRTEQRFLAQRFTRLQAEAVKIALERKGEKGKIIIIKLNKK